MKYGKSVPVSVPVICSSICSSMENFHIEVEHLRSIFKCNNYPVNIIDKCITKFLDKLYVPKQIVLTVPKKELLVVLPFLGTFSLNLRKRLHKAVSKSLPQCNIRVIFQSKNRLSSLFKFKDSIPLYLRSHVIYKFHCSNCNITNYGETERHFKVRAGEHISQASAYEACDRTRTSLHTPKTLETCKKKHALFDLKSFKVCGRSHL